MSSASQPLSAYSPDTCMFCRQPLRIATGADTDAPEDAGEGEPATVIDDVEFHCNSGPSDHHAHWTCLIDRAVQTHARGLPAFTTCAVCGADVRDPSGRFVVDVRNEGGETEGFDFGAILEEEVFLDANPEQVGNRAFHDLVAEGDYIEARKLVEEEGVDVDCTYGENGLTALQKAVFSGDASGVEFLKSLGART